MPVSRFAFALPILLLTACASHPRATLFDAIHKRDPQTLASLLSAGAGPDQKDSRGLTPLIWSVRDGSVPLIQVLLQHRADPNLRGGVNDWTPLMHAVHKNRLDSARALLDGGAIVDSRGRSGETALMMAAGYGYTPLVELLLDRGADPRAVSSDGYNVLAAALGGTPDLDHFTIGSCHADTVRALKRKDPTLHLPDNLWARVAQVAGGVAKLRGCPY